MNELQIERSGGNFARDHINNIELTYRETMLLQEAEPDNEEHKIQNPFEELGLMLNEFFTNDLLNNECTLVSGEDLCRIFDVCMFLADQIDNQRIRA